jgi:hypothetical protein
MDQTAISFAVLGATVPAQKREWIYFSILAHKTWHFNSLSCKILRKM